VRVVGRWDDFEGLELVVEKFAFVQLSLEVEIGLFGLLKDGLQTLLVL
jgi:hypothetical protein